MLVSSCFPTIFSSKLYTLIIITLTGVMSNNCVLNGKSTTVLQDCFIFKLHLNPSSLRRQFLFEFCTCIADIYICVYIHTYIHTSGRDNRRNTTDNTTDSRELLSLRGNTQIRVSTCCDQNNFFLLKSV